MSERSRLRLAILRVLVLSLLATLLGRLWFLQVMAGERYEAIAQSNRVRSVITAAPRGRILDVAGRELVRNRTATVVTVNRTELDRLGGDQAEVVERLAGVLSMAPAELYERVRPCGSLALRGAPPAPPEVPCWNGSPFQPVVVAQDVTPEVSFAIQEHREDFPGVEAGIQAIREYPARAIASHTLGYISPVTTEELNRRGFEDYRSTDYIGRSGLEQTYDRELRGASGVRTVAVNSRGRVTGVVSDDPPVPGSDLITSLDLKVQQVAENALRENILAARERVDERNTKEKYKAPSGAVVVMEAGTGRVVALASYPTYDPTAFIGGISKSEYAALTDTSAGVPLTSRATQGLFAPASTFKIVSTASAVVTGQASLDGSYDCPSRFTVGNRAFRNFDEAGLGSISLRTALVKSCDTVYYRFAYDQFLADQRRTRADQKAAEHLQAMARVFGFGRKTGIDLPSEARGRIVDRVFKQRRWEEQKAFYCRGAQVESDPYIRAIQKENCEGGFRYQGGEHVNLSVGQGDTVVTPLQLAVAYTALANGGTVFEPRLAKAVVDPSGRVMRRVSPPVKGHLSVPGDVLAYMRSALSDVPTVGTAAGAFRGFDFGALAVAGKTGTAEVYGKQDTSWFASFAPAQDPEFVVVAMVEQAGSGGAVAAPITRDIYEGIYGLGGKNAALVDGKLPDALPTVLPDGAILGPGVPVPTASPSPSSDPAVVSATPTAQALGRGERRGRARA